MIQTPQGQDPVSTIYGPADKALAATVLPDISMITNTSVDAITGAFSR
jgi:hypothetical protein